MQTQRTASNGAAAVMVPCWARMAALPRFRKIADVQQSTPFWTFGQSISHVIEGLGVVMPAHHSWHHSEPALHTTRDASGERTRTNNVPTSSVPSTVRKR